MKIVLVNPSSKEAIKGNNPDFLNSEIGLYPPLGLLYLASYTRKHTNSEIKVVDCNVTNLNELQLTLTSFAPDLVGIYVSTFNLFKSLEIASLAKKISRQIKVVLGGPHPTIFPQYSVSYPNVDTVVSGEGEIPFVELVKDVAAGKELLKMYKAVDYINNLDQLPFPDRTLISYKQYTSVLGKQNAMTTMMTSRGCPFKCIYCDRPQMGKIYRARSAENVLAEIKECLSLGISEILFFDDLFTFDKKRVFEICDKIIGDKLKFSWSIRSRVDTIDEKMLKMLKQAGCIRISYGIESGSQKVLDTLKKGITVEKVKEVIAATKAQGIEVLADYMIGSPGETLEDFETTLKLALELDTTFSQFAITTPYPATELYEYGLQQGLFPYDYWDEFAKHPTKDFFPRFWEDNFSRKELVELRKKAYRQFYSRPTYIMRTLTKMRSINELLSKARAAVKILAYGLNGKI